MSRPPGGPEKAQNASEKEGGVSPLLMAQTNLELLWSGAIHVLISVSAMAVMTSNSLVKLSRV